MRPTLLVPATCLACTTLLLLAGCGAPEGLRATPAGDGPRIVVDWDAEPLPEIPFPNDLATRLDSDSPTGLYLNFSEEAPTELERRARRQVNKMSGFGVYSPITVRFEALLDLDNIVARHPDDYDTSDDAFLIIDVNPASPHFGEAAELDVGHGRFPGDLLNPTRYFPNEPRAETASLLFELVEEDLNANGILDEGEDTDSDGVLDHPNVYPEGGDPRQDLLTWYERETNTLIMRPVVPLREENRYAVVLTSRLVDADGQAVVSPWEWVNHTRQTQDLRALVDILPTFGLTVEDVSFAWTFTTGRITGDMFDVRDGLMGQGPFAALADEYPPGIHTAYPVYDDPDGGNNYALPAERFFPVLNSLGLFGDNGDTLVALYEQTSHVVGGAFTTPSFLVDRDDGGDGDMTDEWWDIDAKTGEYVAGPERVPFTCTIPKASEGFQQPFPVGFFGHGYGSSRFEGLGFTWALNRLGWAVCITDFPGHGVTLDPEDLEVLQPVLEATGLIPFLDHLHEDRDVDVTNDGVGDSGADQWTSDGFHTADMVRQSVVDWTQMIRSLDACGTGTMGVDVNGDGVDEVSCDWDGDGVPDLGGPGARYVLMGGSLGGINAAVAAAVEPRFEASAPIVAGAGFMDIGWRSPLGGVVEAVVGRVMSPIFLGRPQEDGTLNITQMVMSGQDDEERPVATLPSVPAGGRITVSNLANGETRSASIPADGALRVHVPADAMDYWEKRVATGMPRTGPLEGAIYQVADNEGLGDRLSIRVEDAEGTEVAVIETFETEITHEGVTMAAGSPLIALSSGLGHRRGTPRLRRVVNVLAQVTEPGDPIAYSPYYFERASEVRDGEPVNILLMPTAGDEIVCVATEYALARASNLYDRHAVDERYGMTVDRWLIETEAIRGAEQWGPWEDKQGDGVLFDVDDMDGGIDMFGEPSHAPLLASVTTSAGVSGMRVPYASPRGSHGMGLPDTSLPFDIATYSIMQASWYLATGGQELLDDPCFEDLSCAFFRTLDP